MYWSMHNPKELFVRYYYPYSYYAMCYFCRNPLKHNMVATIVDISYNKFSDCKCESLQIFSGYKDTVNV